MRRRPKGSLTDEDVSAAHELALAHPDLPMVLSCIFGGLGVHQAVVPLMRRLPNVYMDILGILQYWRTVVRELGAERVLFVTCAPFSDPGIYVSNVQYARDISPDDKRLICGDNLRRLLSEVV